MEPDSVKTILEDPTYRTFKRRAAKIRSSMTVLAVFAYGSYTWLTGYAGDWFSQPLMDTGSVSIGLAWIAGSILLLLGTEVLYEWYCRKKLDPLRAALMARFPGRKHDETE